MEILGIIPARANSKGIPQKNLQKINGISLVENTIKIAKKSKKISRLILTTDSEKIAKIGKKLEIWSRVPGLHRSHVGLTDDFTNADNH